MIDAGAVLEEGMMHMLASHTKGKGLLWGFLLVAVDGLLT